MSKSISSAMVVLSMLALNVCADPAADVKAAAKKLADSANYSWKSTVEGGFGAGETLGKTEKDGYTTLSMSIGDNTVEAVMKGDQAAVKLQDGWKTIAEATGGDAGQ